MFDATILITAIGGSGHGEQILKAARLSKNLNLRIIGTDSRPEAHQYDWVDSAYQLPLASSPDYMDALLDLCMENGVQAVLHGSEPEMLRISGERDRLVQNGIIPIMNSADVIAICGDKIRTSEFLEEGGFNPPKWQYLRDLDRIESIDFYPVIVKPFRSSGGSTHVYIAQDINELSALSGYLRQYSELGLMIQQYVGTSESEYTVGVLSSLTGQVVSGIALKRDLSGSLSVRTRVPNRTSSSKLGSTLVVSSGVSQGRIDDYQQIVEYCIDVARGLDSRGGINFQCRIDEDGVRIFEINPRLSGTTSLRAINGYNEVEYLIRTEVLGETDVPTPVAIAGGIERGLTEFRI